MLKLNCFVSVLAIAILVPQQVFANEQRTTIALYGGAFEAFESENRATEMGVEYRFPSQPDILNLIPTLGLAVNSDGSYWAYSGVRYDWQLNPKWILTPHVAVAAYEEGAGLDLGHDMEFRLGLDLGYRLTKNSQLAFGIHHMSNAYINDHNPGSESLIFTYSKSF
jgi:hypothetical protein